MPVTYIQLDFV